MKGTWRNTDGKTSREKLKWKKWTENVRNMSRMKLGHEGTLMEKQGKWAEIERKTRRKFRKWRENHWKDKQNERKARRKLGKWKKTNGKWRKTSPNRKTKNLFKKHKPPKIIRAHCFGLVPTAQSMKISIPNPVPISTILLILNLTCCRIHGSHERIFCFPGCGVPLLVWRAITKQWLTAIFVWPPYHWERKCFWAACYIYHILHTAQQILKHMFCIHVVHVQRTLHLASMH